MEYSTNYGATWIEYDINNMPTVTGNVTILIREKTFEGLPDEIITLTFTQNQDVIANDMDKQVYSEDVCDNSDCRVSPANTHMTLHLTENGTNAYELAKILRDTYSGLNVLVAWEVSFYKISADFLDKTAIEKYLKNLLLHNDISYYNFR